MLRIRENNNAAGAKSYYSATADYYSEGQELVGLWRGEAAKRLGLAGEIEKAGWEALCDNVDPGSGQQLTPRMKTNRRIGYDFNFNVPKSVSLLYGLTGDERLVTALRESVHETMTEMEAEVKTRVRKELTNSDRVTGNMVWGEYIHTTGRPVDGVPDPQLHAHCFVFNATWDAEERRWKAVDVAGIKRDAPYFEARFHSRLAGKMADLGLEVVRTPNRWEFAGLPRALLERFSRRTEEIERKARERGIIDAKAKGELGAKTRSRKRKDLTIDQLRADWSNRLTPDDRQAIRAAAAKIGSPAIAPSTDAPEQAVSHAIEHCFEKRSVVPERMLLAEALRRSAGSAAVADVEKEFASRTWLTGHDRGRKVVSTPEVLAEERRMLAFARNGRGSCRRFGDGAEHTFRRDWLNEEQKRAVRHALESRDRVTLIRGAAGVGKTSMMQEAVEAIEQSKGNGDVRVFTFAPSTGASRGVLRDKGFGDAETVAQLLKNPKLQDKVRGQVIWIDEAGLVGTKTMGQIFDLAERVGARVILSGDRRQHGSVERGAALRLLEDEAGLQPAEIREIQRQKGDYKQVVRALSESRVEDAFRQLDHMQWIREVPTAERYNMLASDYVAAVAEGKTALVVSPTHREGKRTTREIRRELKRQGKLSADERRIIVLENRKLSSAQLADPASYSTGDVLCFHQNAVGFKKSQRVVVQGVKGEPLPLDQSERFQAYQPRSLSLAVGDVVRITQNGMTLDKKHALHNGDTYRIAGFDKRGDIVLNNRWTISKDFGHLAYGYVSTSVASQGKDFQRVFIGQSADSLPASSREQFYVSVSRGQEQAIIYTDDKADLLDAVCRSDERLSAIDLFGERERRARVHALQRQSPVADSRPEQRREREPERERLRA